MDQPRNAAAAGGDNDFGALFEQSMRAVAPGEVVRGRVVHVSRDFVTVDIGFKSEGQIPIQEFVDRDGNVEVQDGDEIDVYFDGTDSEHGGVVLSRAKAEQFKVWRDIEEAFQTRRSGRGHHHRQGEGRPQGRRRRRRRSCPARTPTCGRRATSIATSASAAASRSSSSTARAATSWCRAARCWNASASS